MNQRSAICDPQTGKTSSLNEDDLRDLMEKYTRRMAERNSLIAAEVADGSTHREVARRYGLTRQRVSQIVAKGRG